MANTLSTIALVCFILAGLSLLAAVALFFALNTKAAYRELKGQPQTSWISDNKVKKKKEKKVVETPTSKMDVEDEAVTTLDNGEEATEISLMNVYEPGTELMEEDTEPITEVQTRALGWAEEEATTTVLNQTSKKGFIITKRKIFVHSDEILR